MALQRRLNMSQKNVVSILGLEVYKTSPEVVKTLNFRSFKVLYDVILFKMPLT